MENKMETKKITALMDKATVLIAHQSLFIHKLIQTNQVERLSNYRLKEGLGVTLGCLGIAAVVIICYLLVLIF